MKASDLLLALAEYDPTIEWQSADNDDDAPFVHEGDRVQWEVDRDGIRREVGCYTQLCDCI